MAWSLVGVSARTTDTSGDVTLVEPTGAAEGDLIVASIMYRDTTSYTMPAGWTMVAEEKLGNAVDGGIASAVMAYIVRGASAPSYLFANASSGGTMAWVTAYRGGATTAPLDVSSSLTAATASTSLSTGSISPSQAEELIVVLGSVGSGTGANVTDCDATDPGTISGATDTTTNPTVGTWIRRATSQSSAADGGVGGSVFDAVKSGSGATGTITSSAISAVTRGVMIAAAFKLPSSGGTGDLAVTLSGVTLSSTGELPITASVTATLDAATVSSAGELPITASVSSTLDAVAVSGAGELQVSGSVTATLDNCALSSAGSNAFTGTVGVTLEDATVTATGETPPISADVTVTLGSLELSSSATLGLSATVDVTLDDVALVAIGKPPVFASLVANLGDVEASATGEISGSGAVSSTLGDVTLSAELWGGAYDQVPGERTAIPPTFTFTAIEKWDGAGTVSKDLLAHASSSEHHVSVVVSSANATGSLRLRMTPTKMTKPVALGDETEHVDIAVIGGYVTFVVGGYYSSIEAEFTAPLSEGTVTITVASDVIEDERAAPKTTVITTNWNATGTASQSMPDHAPYAMHHIAVACETQPSAGALFVRGRPAGSPSGHVTLCGPYYLTGTGTINVVVSGFYDEFSIAVSDAVVGATSIQARVASIFGAPLTGEEFPLGGRLDVQPPTTASSIGSRGDFAWDSTYLYLCIAKDTWKRIAFGAW